MLPISKRPTHASNFVMTAYNRDPITESGECSCCCVVVVVVLPIAAISSVKSQLLSGWWCRVVASSSGGGGGGEKGGGGLRRSSFPICLARMCTIRLNRNEIIDITQRFGLS